MENPGTPSPGDREERLDGLVRPYVIGAGDNARRPLDRPGNDTPDEPALAETGWFYPASLMEEPPPAEQKQPVVARSSLAAHLRPIGLGVVAVIAAFVCCALLLMPHSSPASLASKCQPSSCDRIAPQTSDTPSLLSPSPSTGPASHHPATPPAQRGPAPSTPASTATTPATTVVASSSPAPSATSTSPPSLTPGSRISIRATTACCTSFYIRHDDTDDRVVITYITSSSPGTTKADATWIVRAGLANSSCISFESANDPGQYLRHYEFELYLEPNDGSSQFAMDATFCPKPGNSGQDTSFESVNYPNMYIRHYDYVVYLASDGGYSPWDTPTLWPYDTTFDVHDPWG